MINAGGRRNRVGPPRVASPNHDHVDVSTNEVYAKSGYDTSGSYTRTSMVMNLWIWPDPIFKHLQNNPCEP